MASETETRAKKLPGWERDLRRVLTEMELANGDHAPGACCDELEMIVRLAWRESNRQLDALRAHGRLDVGEGVPS